jgi:DNA-binding NtrC family response regulator
MSAHTLRLLLVDDDSFQIDYLGFVLRKGVPDTIEVVAINDSQAALDYLKATWVDLLITDLDMPEVRGLDLARAARDRNPAVQTFVLTAASTWDELIQALDLGASDYLLKPIKPELLVNLVVQASERLSRWRTALAGTFEARRKRTVAADAAC